MLFSLFYKVNTINLVESSYCLICDHPKGPPHTLPHHCSSLFVIVRHCSPLFVIVRHCSSLFVIVRRTIPDEQRRGNVWGGPYKSQNPEN